jgi:hypothetical protein
VAKRPTISVHSICAKAPTDRTCQQPTDHLTLNHTDNLRQLRSTISRSKPQPMSPCRIYNLPQSSHF